VVARRGVVAAALTVYSLAPPSSSAVAAGRLFDIFLMFVGCQTDDGCISHPESLPATFSLESKVLDVTIF
jgi:hypothetical protein